MKDTSIIESAKTFVQQMMKNNDPSHDWHHVERVYKNAINIAEEEAKLYEKKIDMDVVELAALFHDVIDFKYDFKESKSLEEIARERLSLFFKDFPNFNEKKINDIIFIVLNLSWRKELEVLGKENDLPIELKIVRDSDRLDAIGAIGISRCLVYSGARNRPIYVEELSPIINITADQYNNQTIQNKGTAINHFYEKLLLLKDRMQTQTGKKLAEQRHDFMISFLNQFKNEVNISS